MRRDALVRRLKFCRASHSHFVQNYTQISKERKILMQKLQLYNLSKHAVFDIESRSGYPNAGNELFRPAHVSRIRIVFYYYVIPITSAYNFFYCSKRIAQLI